VSSRDRILLLIIGVVGLVAGTWLLVIKPQRTQAQKLGAQVQTLQGQLTTAQGQIASGLAARAQFAHNYAELAQLGEALPSDDEVPSLIYQLQAAASGARVDFRTLSMNPAAGSSSASSSTSTSASAASTPPPGSSVGPAGFPTEQFTFTFNGSFFDLSKFFHHLQQFVVANNNHITVSGRLLTVNAISLTAGPTGFPSIMATVSATTYMAPASTGLLNGATPAGPSGSSTATPSTATPTPAAATITPTHS